MKILLTGLPNEGHRVPSEVFIEALKSAGHEVKHQFVVVSDASPTDLSSWLARFQAEIPTWAREIRREINHFKPEILISELPVLAMSFVSEEFNLPWVVFSALPYLFSVPKANLFLQGSLPEFEEKEDHGNIHFIGPIVRKAEGKRVNFSRPRPYVLVTQGTVDVLDDSLIKTVENTISPACYVVSERIEHYLYMEYFDVFITNGGFGGVSLAIYHGIPMVIAPSTEEKPFVAERVERSGLGIDLKTPNPSPEQIKRAVLQVLSSEKIKKRCLEFSELSKARKLSDSVKLLEGIAA